jgi:hypothetical protein
VVIPTKYKDQHGWADCVDRFIQVDKQTDILHTVHVEGIVGPTHFMRENAASDKLHSVWLENNQVNLDINSTVYLVPIPVSRCAGAR